MLTHMRLLSSSKEPKFTFPVFNPDSKTSYLVKDITGLGPPPENLAISDYAFYDGAGFVTSRTDKRNIVVRMSYRPRLAEGETVQLLRRRLYNMFPKKTPILMEFISDDMPAVTIVGYVETHEPVIFSATPATDISIICPQPGFLHSIESVIALPNSEITQSPYITVSNPGDLPVGVRYELRFDRTAPDSPDDMIVYFEHLLPNGEIHRMDIENSKIISQVGARLLKDDLIIFDSRPHYRQLTLKRDVFTYNIMRSLSNRMNPTHWAMVPPGEVHKFRYGVLTPAVFAKTSAIIKLTPMYEGL